ncbi:MAG: ABC transporter permease [Rhodobacteraceae bacterium]|nr:ABC transporter permease [Paracoccaceae bacterium]
MTETTQDGPMLAADGTPLKKSLRRALRAQKLRALGLIAPLLIFVLISFVAPIVDMLFRSVENQIVSDTLPRTVVALRDWDGEGGEAPGDEIFKALTYDFIVAAERKEHTRLGSRLNYEMTGISSLFRKSGRRVDDIGEDYLDQFKDLNDAWEEPATWVAMMASEGWVADQVAWSEARAAAKSADQDFETPEPAFALRPGVAKALPETADIYSAFARTIQTQDEDSPTEEEPWNPVYMALFNDLASNPDAASAFSGDVAALLSEAAAAVGNFETISPKDAFLDADEDWGDPMVWSTIKAFAPSYTSGYFLSAVDLQLTASGVQPQDEDQQIYMLLFKRTLFMSLMIMFSCILLGYPIAFLLSNLPMRQSSLLLILVLLPFWTSLLVRTSSWKVLLQQQGVINDILVWIGLVADDNRLVMINNQFGTIVAMTHILLPFMILPLYSVMKTIPPSYVRAAKSLGATDWTAFWRVYFPQSVPGIGAGCILVFILAIGYYITPELVGGTTGTFISNRIAYHISSSLNWGLAAALGTILLAVVLILYWVYDRIVGIDNVSLG